MAVDPVVPIREVSMKNETRGLSRDDRSGLQGIVSSKREMRVRQVGMSPPPSPGPGGNIIAFVWFPRFIMKLLNALVLPTRLKTATNDRSCRTWACCDSGNRLHCGGCHRVGRLLGRGEREFREEMVDAVDWRSTERIWLATESGEYSSESSTRQTRSRH